MWLHMVTNRLIVVLLMSLGPLFLTKGEHHPKTSAQLTQENPVFYWEHNLVPDQGPNSAVQRTLMLENRRRRSCSQEAVGP